MKTRIIEGIVRSFGCETSNDFKELIQYFKDKDVDIDISKKILTLTDNIDEDTIESIYSNNDLFLKHKFINDHGFEKVNNADKKLNCLNKTRISYKLDDSIKVLIDFKRKQVILNKTMQMKDIDDVEYIIIDAVPIEVKIQDTDFLNLPPRFNITWESTNRNSFFNCDYDEYVSISQIKNSLLEAGFVLNKTRLSDTISAMINCCIEHDFAEVKTMIDNKGVYFDKGLNYLIPVNVNTSNITIDEFDTCQYTLNKLKNMFDEKILATCLKWSMMSIFSFAIKQKKYQLPFLYMVGSSNAGKSTLGRIMMFVHDVYNNENDLEGDSASTEYRYANILSKNCCFRMINEPYALFNTKETVQVFKSSVESLISRKTHDGIYPAFAPALFTANDYVPETDAIFTRLYVIFFGKTLRKDSKEWEKIYNELRITDSENSILKNLNYLGRFAINYVLKNNELLTHDWTKVADKIIQEFFVSFNESCPKWLISWAEQENKLEDLDETQIENIRSILIKELSKARGQVKIIDNEYGTIKEEILEVYDDKVSKSSQFESLFWDIFNERKVAWMIPYSSNKNPQALFLSQPFKNLINKNSDVKYTIKTLAQLLGWKIQTIRLKKTRKTGIVISLKEFLEFVYP